MPALVCITRIPRLVHPIILLHPRIQAPHIPTTRTVHLSHASLHHAINSIHPQLIRALLHTLLHITHQSRRTHLANLTITATQSLIHTGTLKHLQQSINRGTLVSTHRLKRNPNNHLTRILSRQLTRRIRPSHHTLHHIRRITLHLIRHTAIIPLHLIHTQAIIHHTTESPHILHRQQRP